MRPLQRRLEVMFGQLVLRDWRCAVSRDARQRLAHGAQPIELRARVYSQLQLVVTQAENWGRSRDRFDEFVRDYGPLIEQVLVRWRERDQARQYLWGDLWRTWERVGTGQKSRPIPRFFQSEGPYGPLVRRYARHAGLRTVRRRRPEIEVTWPLDISDLAPLSSVERAENAAEAWLMEQKFLAVVEHHLTPMQRRIVQIRWDAMRGDHSVVPTEAIAQLLGKSVNAVNTHYSRAKKLLRERGIDLDKAEDLCREWSACERRYKPNTHSPGNRRSNSRLHPPMGGEA